MKNKQMKRRLKELDEKTKKTEQLERDFGIKLPALMDAWGRLRVEFTDKIGRKE